MKKFLWLLMPLFLFSASECVILPVPKSGTHQVAKLLDLLAKDGHNVPYVWTHFGEELECRPHVDPRAYRRVQNHAVKKIVNVRDPRDLVVSALYYIDAGRAWIQRSVGAFGPHYQRIPNKSDRLSYILGMREPNYINQSLRRCCKAAVQCSKLPNTIVVKFEDLVGARGGGSDAAQHKTIMRITKHLGLELTSAEIDSLCSRLFGNTDIFHRGFFRQGAIGTWKTHLTKKQVEMCELKFEKYMKRFGYSYNL